VGSAVPADGRVLANFVGGTYRPPRDGRVSEVVDPSTGEAYLQAPVSGPADVDKALQVAARAFEAWRDTTPAERSLALLRFADAIEIRAEDLVEAESRNTGKPVAMTRADEIPPLADELRFFAAAARVLEGRSAGEYLRGHTSMSRREPVGVCAQVTPWNYPMMMAVWKFAPALAAGNTVVQGSRPGHARGAAAGLRCGLDQHPYPVRLGDAAAPGRDRRGILGRPGLPMNFEAMVKDAAVSGLAAGVIFMAGAQLLMIGLYLAKPGTTVAAAIAPTPFGFGPPA
jgi:hypothetical protein